MHLFIFFCLFIVESFVAGSYFAVIHDTDGEENCRVWSDSNHGCTGYSATFVKLKGKDCSRFISAGSDDDSMQVDLCGTEDGEHVAWVTVSKNGTVNFLNREGKTSSCTLGNGLQVPSNCSIGNTVSSQSSASISTRSQSLFTTTIGRSGSQSARCNQSSAPIYTSTSTNSAHLASISDAESTTESPLADQYPNLTYSPACTCSCKSAVVS
ncbi:unnamed protein product [Penicillium salamii]|uniref:Uncharacterized protein n=1 Tax=Penicillium salamii TaxID=1612424 RepID=A0A9W4N5M9_9EURO|nr:unnamed protein product [Penicillium salamii]